MFRGLSLFCKKYQNKNHTNENVRDWQIFIFCNGNYWKQILFHSVKMCHFCLFYTKVHYCNTLIFRSLIIHWLQQNSTENKRRVMSGYFVLLKLSDIFISCLIQKNNSMMEWNCENGDKAEFSGLQHLSCMSWKS